MKKVFVNLTNHPSAKWNSEQLSEAKKYGDIIDMNFPQVSPTANILDIMGLAKSMVADICGTYDSDTELHILVQGEMTLTYALVSEFHKKEVDCYAACSDRVTEEVVNPDGTTSKKSTFKFVQFREYPTF